MWNIAKNYASPMASIFLVTIASTLAMTGQTLILHYAKFDPTIIGWLSAAYFAGFVFATFAIERYILKVSHIRAFAVFSSMFCALLLLQGLFFNPYLWAIFRFGAGIANAALFIIIESWMLAAGDRRSRTIALALYMMVYYLSQILGQFLIVIGIHNILQLFSVSAIFAALAIIPLANTRVPSPEFSEPSYLNIFRLIKMSPSGFLGAFFAGVIVSVIYTLLPAVFASQVGRIPMKIASLMGITIFGGFVLQYPIGVLSNYIDRRSVLLALFVTIGLISIAALMIPLSSMWVVLLFLYGAASLTLYPISISHACDTLPHNSLIAATQALVLTNTLGFIVGPIVCGYMLTLGDLKSSFAYYNLIIAAPAILYFSLRWLFVGRAPAADRHDFVALARTTPVVAEIDPRSADDG